MSDECGAAGAERWSERVTAAAGTPVVAPPLRPERSRSVRWAREVLPPVGGTVLDVGCGAGAAALALVPPASELIGVDPRGALLDRFVDAAATRGVARRTVHGTWPDVAAITPVADVVICRHVAYDVVDLLPFVAVLTARARLAVVVEVTAEHPTGVLRRVAARLCGWERAPVLDHRDLLAVLTEAGLDPEWVGHGDLADAAGSGAAPHVIAPDEVAAVSRWLGLDETHHDEVGRVLADEMAASADDSVTFRWPGDGDAELHGFGRGQPSA